MVDVRSLSQVVDVLNAEFGVETSSEAAYGAREAALKLAGLSLTGEPLSDEPNVTARDFPSPPRPETLLQRRNHRNLLVSLH